MGCVRHSAAPLPTRVRASFCTAVAVSLLLLVNCIWQIGAGGLPAREGRRLNGLYPDDALLSQPYGEDPHRWLVVLHCLGIGYMLLGLNTVCDVYFTGALEVMVEMWHIKPDVAGATFMAAGGSAPEFFTSLIGATWVMSDVGFSTIVGSAVFNVLFVIGLCGYVANGDIQLTWWPLFRDCAFYIFGLSLLAFCAFDGSIGLAEACGLFFAYLLYCTIMYYNPSLEQLVDAKLRRAAKQVAPFNEPFPDPLTTAPQLFPAASWILEDLEIERVPTILSLEPTPKATPKADVTFKGDAVPGNASPFYKSQGSCETETTNALSATMETGTVSTPVIPLDCEASREPSREASSNDKAPSASRETSEPKTEESSEEDDGNFMRFPQGRLDRAVWFASLPIHGPIYFLIPRPRAEKHIFVATFMLSLVWIAGFAFLLVWWTNTLAEVLHIPGVLKDFTLLAMGTSIPDAASSVAVTRAGEGDMAVSSSIGSNVFDILVGLPVPWIIKILLEGGSFDYKVRIHSPFLVFYVLLLLGMVFSVVLSIHFLGWKLNKALGTAMAFLYVIFLSTAVSMEVLRPEALMF